MSRSQPPKPKKLSPLARRRLLANARAREKASVLRELSYFGTALCECGHLKERHRRRRDGSTVCKACWAEVRSHPFRPLLQQAREYFAALPEDDLSITLDAGGSDVVEYEPILPDTDSGNHYKENTMAVSQKARVRKPAPPRTQPPARAARPAAVEETGNSCLCGCGEETKSRFRPGHDAKLKSRLTTQALEGATAKERAVAERRMEKLGWGDLLEKSRASRAAKAAKPKAEKGVRTEAQKRATAKMRAASTKRQVAEPEDDVDEDDVLDEVEDEEEEDDEEDEEE